VTPKVTAPGDTDLVTPLTREVISDGMLVTVRFRVVQRYLSLRVIRERATHINDVFAVCGYSARHHGCAVRPHGS